MPSLAQSFVVSPVRCDVRSHDDCMFLRQIDLTTALRPSLLPDETLLFVQDAVGLYAGKFKLPDYQSGQAYLTSHRACYVDNEEPRKRAVAIDLKDVDRVELYAGFLKSSPKVTFLPKASRLNLASVRHSGPIAASSSPASRTGSPLRPSFEPPRASNATWICPICSFSNPVPPNFDPAIANETTPLPPCQACGIKPPLVNVIKAAIAGLSNRPQNGSAKANVCPRCTFENHPSLHTCEVCGASLQSSAPASSGSTPLQSSSAQSSSARNSLDQRPDSPGPQVASQDISATLANPTESVKFSFRVGGEKTFHDRLKQALTQRKWLLQATPKYPSGSTEHGQNPQQAPPPPRGIGIAGLERRGMELRKNNELVIGNAFEDLEALMASAKEIIALAETFANQTRPDNQQETNDASALLSQLNLSTTRDMLGSANSTTNNTYLTELSRQLAEYLTDDARGILRHEGGIISLVDLWAVFNRARGGVELVSPADIAAATGMFDKLKLPVRQRRFKSGLLVVQERSRTDEKTVAALVGWLKDFQEIPPDAPLVWDWRVFGQGVTAQQTAEMFGWSIGVATEELEMAEERGALCREVGMEGVKFWQNFLSVSESQ
ncbi:hypothetical protein FH972_023873 [Carpinus fangiana]|uniref:Vacuolar protein-sorting-associated protein 36 n=1 Tax=Carpinus fangiana TaxID=176857 RepID=A0A5N6KYY0_9ROSI|nr:hypothetical protein FH972_023873 [Carpinus fangiana]